MEESFGYLLNLIPRTKLLFHPSHHLSARMKRAPSLGALQSIDGASEREGGRVWARASCWRNYKIPGTRPPLGEVSELGAELRSQYPPQTAGLFTSESAGSVSWFRVKNWQHQSTASFVLVWKVHVSLCSSTEEVFWLVIHYHGRAICSFNEESTVPVLFTVNLLITRPRWDPK